jgi:3-dehydroquinate dehydratase II
VRNRVEVMHGVNLDQLGRRDPAVYGGLSLDDLERRIGDMARRRGLEARFFQTNHEGEFVEHLHRLDGLADGVVLNPGAWTHYAWSIRDALELTGLPAVEVHLSDVMKREEFRRVSVVRDICIHTVSGRGPDGYDEALERLEKEFAS